MIQLCPRVYLRFSPSLLEFVENKKSVVLTHISFFVFSLPKKKDGQTGFFLTIIPRTEQHLLFRNYLTSNTYFMYVCYSCIGHNMIEQTIKKWLNDFKNEYPNDSCTSSVTVACDGNVVSALHSYLDDISKYQGVSSHINIIDIMSYNGVIRQLIT